MRLAVQNLTLNFFFIFISSRIAIALKISGLKSQVSGLRSEISDLRSQVGGLRSEVWGLRSEVSGLRSDYIVSTQIVNIWYLRDYYVWYMWISNCKWWWKIEENLLDENDPQKTLKFWKKYWCIWWISASGRLWYPNSKQVQG